jgi:Dehydrogenases with different specificities (related to short-chain alcohol dehydrogenases)
MKIKGKTAIITGGGTGIGRAIALELAREGANVVINYSRSHDEAMQTLREVREAGGDGEVFRANVSSESEVDQMCRYVADKYKSIDILINNAGTTNYVALEDLDGLLDDYWNRAFNVNAKGIFLTSRACSAHLRKSKGAIVNITSIAGFNGMGSSIAYAASKAAAISITKSLARVLAPDVRVNAIAPGIVRTRWVDGREDHVERYGSGTPLGRVANPEDVAEMTVALIKGGDFVTGQTIIVDGGKTIL